MLSMCGLMYLKYKTMDAYVRDRSLKPLGELVYMHWTNPVLARSNAWTWGSSSKSDLNATSRILWNIDKHSWLHLDFSVSL